MGSEHQHVSRLSRDSKRHAVLRDRPGSVLWVFDQHDWQTMLDNDHALVCPEPGCAVRLFPRPRSPQSKMARHLWLGPKHSGGCDHWIGGSDGGLMTPRHLWVQTRILRICRELGYAAIPEDQNTRADVFVTEPATALEVQLRGTEFKDRTAARAAKGADTIWFLGHEVSRQIKSVQDALATLPAVRFKVIDTSSRNWKAPEFEPWTDPENLDERADIRVYATVFTLNPAADPPRLERDFMPIRQFLDEVLSGQRRWIPRGQPGMPLNLNRRHRPGWVRPDELDAACPPQPSTHSATVTPPETVARCAVVPQPQTASDPAFAAAPVTPPEHHPVTPPEQLTGRLIVLAVVVVAAMVVGLIVVLA